jgi:hypothetical protein
MQMSTNTHSLKAGFFNLIILYGDIKLANVRNNSNL